jgi:hypothetical protein
VAYDPASGHIITYHVRADASLFHRAILEF